MSMEPPVEPPFLADKIDALNAHGQIEPPSLADMINALNAHSQIIAGYKPIERQGMLLKPILGTTAAALEAAITPTLALGDWIVTSLKGGEVLIEPRETRLVKIHPPGCAFHVTSRDNRYGIQKNGLQLHTGGNTRMQRKYPPRIFVALDLHAAFEFAEFQCRHPTPISPVDENLIRQLDIWRVWLPGKVVLHRDILFPGRAGWTDQPIPRPCVSRVWYWREARCFWYFLRRMGAV